MKKSVIVAIVAGAITIAAIWPPRPKTIGTYDVDLSRSGRTELPLRNHLCCGSRLLIYLEVPINVARGCSPKTLLETTRLECEIKTRGSQNDDTIARKIALVKDGSWSGPWLTRQVYLGGNEVGEIRGLSLLAENGCPRLAGAKQRLIVKKTPCMMTIGFSMIWRLPIFCMAGLTTLIALWIAFFSKKKSVEPPAVQEPKV